MGSKGDWDGRGIFPELGMVKKMKQQFPTSSSTSQLSALVPALPKVGFLLLERGKRRHGLWIIGRLSLKSQIIPAGQEMEPGKSGNDSVLGG